MGFKGAGLVSDIVSVTSETCGPQGRGGQGKVDLLSQTLKSMNLMSSDPLYNDGNWKSYVCKGIINTPNYKGINFVSGQFEPEIQVL